MVEDAAELDIKICGDKDCCFSAHLDNRLVTVVILFLKKVSKKLVPPCRERKNDKKTNLKFFSETH